MNPNDPSLARKQAILGGLLKRRTLILPTWKGWLALLLTGGALFAWVFSGIHGFLAESQPAPANILVVEGYAEDDMLLGAVAEFKKNRYDKLIVTGGPIERGGPLSEYKTLPDLCVATLEKMGVDRSALQPVATGAVLKDRTYASAVALREWLRSQKLSVHGINVIAAGLHARRTHLLFQEAFGPSVPMGIIAYVSPDTDTAHWWRSSEEVRGVISEGLAYIYARFLFRKPN